MKTLGKINKLSKTISILILLFYCLVSSADNGPFPIHFELNKAATTSAGIYKSSNGQLIRTLWSNVKYNSGQHIYYWDYLDDNNTLVTDTGLTFKILSNNLQYTWEGVIGNTSDSSTGPSKIRAFKRFHTLSISGQYAYYGIGYNEAHPSCFKFDLKNPQNKINILENYQGDIDQECQFVASDDSSVYWAGFDPYNKEINFVYATSTRTDQEIDFSAGSNLQMTYGRNYISTIDLIKDDINAHPSGLCVQNKGKFLFVSHSGLNKIHVLDKKSGELLSEFSISEPGPIVCDANHVWVIQSKNKIIQLRVSQNGELSFVDTVIDGFELALNLCISKDFNTLMVTDGGSSQQVKAYDIRSLSLLWTLGQKGGYQNDPLVFYDKFYFSDTVTDLNIPFIESQDDGSFWIGDVGNERVLHFDKDRNFIEYIMCLPHTYSISVDQNRPERAINEFLEFKINYSKTLKPNNGSWDLYKNWRAYIRPDYYQNDVMGIFRQLTEFSNGNSYALIDRFENGIRKSELVELPAKGPLRYTGKSLGDFANVIITKEGHIRNLNFSRNFGDSGYWEQYSFDGFDANSNPTWKNPVIDTYLPVVDSTDPAFSHISTPVITKNAFNIVFNAEKENTGYHLGAIRTGDSTWLWKTCLATNRNYSGPMPKDGRFDIGNKVEYPGGNVLALDEFIFWNYHGEFWKNSQSNIWNVYHENGLMIGQFGITSLEGENITKEAFPQGAGNVFSIALVKNKNDYYLYHNDESVHGGLHRWKISGANTSIEQNIRLKTRALNTGMKGQYFKSNDLDPVYLAFENQLDNIAVINSNDEINSIRLSAYVNSNLTDSNQLIFKVTSGIRVFLGSEVLIDQWNNKDEKEFVSRYLSKNDINKPLVIEIKGNQIECFTIKNNIKSALESLYFNATKYESTEGIDLMMGLRRGIELENGFYGWTRSETNQDEFQCQTGLKSLSPITDITLKYFSEKNDYFIDRNLKGFQACENWTIKGSINFEENIPNFTENVMLIEILDTNSKRIAVIEQKMLNLDELSYPTQISCNGDAIVNQSFQKLNYLQNFNKEFEVIILGKQVEFHYGNLIPIRVSIMDTDADVSAPGRLVVRMKSGSMTTLKTMSLSQLKLTKSSKFVLRMPSKLTFCNGDSVSISAPEAKEYRWNTGAKTQTIQIKSSQKVWLEQLENNCQIRSDTIEFKRYSIPNKIIIRKGDSLNSQIIQERHQWFKDSIIIPNEEGNKLRIKELGIYFFQITDSNGCFHQSDEYPIYKLGFEEATKINLIIYPNPSKGKFRLYSDSRYILHYQIINPLGKLIKTGEINPTEEQEIELEQYGVYSLMAWNNQHKWTNTIVVLPLE